MITAIVDLAIHKPSNKSYIGPGQYNVSVRILSPFKRYKQQTSCNSVFIIYTHTTRRKDEI